MEAESLADMLVPLGAVARVCEVSSEWLAFRLLEEGVALGDDLGALRDHLASAARKGGGDDWRVFSAHDFGPDNIIRLVQILEECYRLKSWRPNAQAAAAMLRGELPTNLPNAAMLSKMEARMFPPNEKVIDEASPPLSDSQLEGLHKKMIERMEARMFVDKILSPEEQAEAVKAKLPPREIEFEALPTHRGIPMDEAAAVALGYIAPPTISPSDGSPVADTSPDATAAGTVAEGGVSPPSIEEEFQAIGRARNASDFTEDEAAYGGAVSGGKTVTHLADGSGVPARKVAAMMEPPRRLPGRDPSAYISLDTNAIYVAPEDAESPAVQARIVEATSFGAIDHQVDVTIEGLDQDWKPQVEIVQVPHPFGDSLNLLDAIQTAMGPSFTREELIERGTFTGGSEAAVAAGLVESRSRVALAAEKQSLLEGDEPEDRKVSGAGWGHVHEHVARTIYLLQRRVDEPGLVAESGLDLVRHRTDPRRGAHIDFVMHDGTASLLEMVERDGTWESSGPPCVEVWEVKAPRFAGADWADEDGDGLFFRAKCQVLWARHILESHGITVTSSGVLCHSFPWPRAYAVEPDDDLLRVLIAGHTNMWHCIDAGVAPRAELTAAGAQAIKKHWAGQANGQAVATAKVERLARAFAKWKHNRKLSEKAYQTYRVKVLEHMTDNSELVNEAGDLLIKRSKNGALREAAGLLEE